MSLFAVSSFFPFLEEWQGSKGLAEVRRAIVDTAHWFLIWLPSRRPSRVARAGLDS